jgi:hypothetical protein
MSIETTIEQAEFNLTTTPYGSTSSTRAASTSPGWILGMLVAVLAVAYLLVGWVHDVQRIRSLEAVPSPPSKVITKSQAWQQIYSRSVR